MEDEAALLIRVLESRLGSYCRCEDGRYHVAEERHSVFFFFKLLRWVCAVVERRAPHWVSGCAHVVRNDLCYPNPTIHNMVFEDEGLVLLAEWLVFGAKPFFSLLHIDVKAQFFIASDNSVKKTLFVSFCWAMSSDCGALIFVVFVKVCGTRALCFWTFPIEWRWFTTVVFYHTPSAPPILWSLDMDFREEVDSVALHQTLLVDLCVIHRWGQNSPLFFKARNPTAGGNSQYTAQILRAASAALIPCLNTEWCRKCSLLSSWHSILMIWKYTKFNRMKNESAQYILEVGSSKCIGTPELTKSSHKKKQFLKTNVSTFENTRNSWGIKYK